jgi:hypothetical protein
MPFSKQIPAVFQQMARPGKEHNLRIISRHPFSMDRKKLFAL